MLKKYLLSAVALSAMISTFDVQAMFEPGNDRKSTSPKAQRLSSSPKGKEEAGSPDKHVPQQINQDPLLLELQEKIGYRFKNPELLILALRHSATDIGHTLSSRGFERLEFFGDSVLELIMREILWNDYQHLNDREFKKTCAILVDSERLAFVSNALELPQISKLLKLAPKAFNPTSLNSHSRANFVESLIGALYEDGGLKAGKAFVQHFWRSEKASPVFSEVFKTLAPQAMNPDEEGSMLSQPHLRRLYYTDVRRNTSLEFLGEGVLRLVIREFLCRRFPEATEGILSQKYDAITCTTSINAISEAFKIDPNNNALAKLIGLMYLDGGLEKASDYILWHWTSKRAPKVIKATLKKGLGAPTTLSTTRLESSFKTLPHPKTLLQELLTLVFDKPIYTSSQDGEAHQPVFTTAVRSASIGDFKAQGKIKVDTETEVARLALSELSARVLANLFISREDFLKSGAPCELPLKVLEARLMLLGFNSFSYHVLAKQTQGKDSVYRIEIHGKNILPSCGENADINIAKTIAVSNTLKKLLKEEYKKVEYAVADGKNSLINEELLSFFLQVCEHILQAKGLKGIYEPFAKSDIKVEPVLTFKMTCEDHLPIEARKVELFRPLPLMNVQMTCDGLKPLQGRGYTPLQAKLSAAINLIHTIIPELKLKSKIKGEKGMMPVGRQPVPAVESPIRIAAVPSGLSIALEPVKFVPVPKGPQKQHKADQVRENAKVVGSPAPKKAGQTKGQGAAAPKVVGKAPPKNIGSTKRAAKKGGNKAGAKK